MDKQEQYEDLCAQLQNEGYRRTDCTISPALGLSLSFLCAMPLTWVIGEVFRRVALARAQIVPLGSRDFLRALVITTLIAVALHEIIRALAWVVSSGQGTRAVGFSRKGCYCKVALPRRTYLVGVLAPAVVLSVGSVVAMFALPNTATMLLAFIGLMAGGSDLLLALFLAGAPAALIVDDPKDIGYAAFKREG